MFDAKLLIRNEDVAAADGGTFTRANPISNEVVTRAAAATVRDAVAAADSAAAAFTAWSALGPAARRSRLLRAADILEQRAQDAAARMAAETGSTAAWAQLNVHLWAGMLREAAALTTQVAGEVIPSDKPHLVAMSIRQPVGVVFGMAPWNAPIILGVRAIATPLACGNTVVFKASEMCPATHRLIGEVLCESNLPPGTVNVVSNAPENAAEVVEALISHRSVRRISFTGSTRVGRIINQCAARHLKRAVLELGGKAPLLVLEDADLDEAAKAATFGAFMNQGQICMSTERIVVDARVADEFVAKFAARTRTLRAGDPQSQKSVLGPMISAEAAERVRRLIQDAVAKGATLVVGGNVNGALMDATILDHVTPAMQTYEEESFGPIVTVVRVKGEEEAIRVANDTEYGLSAAIFSRDVGRALEIAKRIESGICHINGPTVQDEPQMPFGGLKGSGYGRFGGRAAIEEFTELRWLTIATQSQHYPF